MSESEKNLGFEVIHAYNGNEHPWDTIYSYEIWGENKEGVANVIFFETIEEMEYRGGYLIRYSRMEDSITEQSITFAPSSKNSTTKPKSSKKIK